METIESRISAVQVDAPPEEPKNEAVRESPERQDSSPPEPAQETGAPSGEQAGEGVQPEAGEQDANAGDSEAVEIGTLSELAEHLGAEVSDLYNLRIPVTSGTEKKEISLSEWKDSYQTADHYKKQQEELGAARKALETEREQRMADLEKSKLAASTAMKLAETQLLGDYEKVNWDALRESDPAQYSVLKQDFTEKRQALAQAQQEAFLQLQQDQQQQAAEMQRAAQETLQKEGEALLTALPQWKDPDVAKTERSELKGYLAGLGYEASEIDSVMDHRMVTMAYKAMQFDAKVKAVDVTKKQVVRIGKKTLKPGAKQSKTQGREDALVSLKKQLHKSGKMDDAAALISARLKR